MLSKILKVLFLSSVLSEGLANNTEMDKSVFSDANFMEVLKDKCKNKARKPAQPKAMYNIQLMSRNIKIIPITKQPNIQYVAYFAICFTNRYSGGNKNRVLIPRIPITTDH